MTKPSAAVWSATALLLALALTLPAAEADARRRKKAKPAPVLPGELVIFSTNDGPTVEVDGQVIGTLPLDDSLAMEPGQHTIRVSQRGYSEYIDTFTVEAGEEVEVEVDLIPLSAIVRITTPDPGATVKVDGKVLGVTPFDQDIEPGKKIVAVSSPGFFENVAEHQFVAGRSYDLTVTLEPMPVAPTPPPVADDEGVHEKWWFWTAIGVAVAGGTAAAIAIAATSGGDGVPAPSATIDIP